MNSPVEKIAGDGFKVKASSFEYHAQTILAAVVLGILAWVGWSIIQLGEKQAVLIADVRVMTVKLDNVETKVTDVVNGYVTKAEIVYFQNEVLSLHGEVNELEDRVDDLEVGFESLRIH